MSGWLFDLGNSRLKLAPLGADAGPGDVVAVAHDGIAFAEGWRQVLPATLDMAWICSVGPPALCADLAAALAARGARLQHATTAPRLAGITVAYSDPARLGVDRVLAMAAAHARDATPALVVGVGTALTVDLVDGSGWHRGGRIAPSPALMRAALQQRAPQLPETGGTYAEFGTDTASALAAGCTGAALGLVERSRTQAHALLGVTPRLWLHGGGARSLAAHLDDAGCVPALVLEGLARWAVGEGHATQQEGPV
ncbi:type III pantothenate kinase [soil metagenome]